MMLKLCEPDFDSNEACDTPDSFADTPTKFQPIHTSSLYQPILSLTRAGAASLPSECSDSLTITTLSRSPPPPMRKEESHIARSLTDQPTCSLHHEFSLLNRNMPHVEVDLLDAIKRFAVFKISAGGHVVVLQVNLYFPCFTTNFIVVLLYFSYRQFFQLSIRVRILDPNSPFVKALHFMNSCLPFCLRHSKRTLCNVLKNHAPVLNNACVRW